VYGIGVEDGVDEVKADSTEGFAAENGIITEFFKSGPNGVFDFVEVLETLGLVY